ncbi:hypothetical protein AOLI_G00077760 [Acnodon oligacanthus]
MIHCCQALYLAILCIAVSGLVQYVLVRLLRGCVEDHAGTAGDVGCCCYDSSSAQALAEGEAVQDSPDVPQPNSTATPLFPQASI